MPRYRPFVIRRSFRIGLWLGLLGGLGWALAKVLRPRPSPSMIDLGPRGDALGPTPNAWPPLEAAAATPEPIQVPEPMVEPIETTEPGLVMIGDTPLQTPPEAVRTTLSERPSDAAPPAPPPAPPPPPAQQAVTKKTAPKKKAAAAKKEPVAKKTLAPWVDPDNGICPKSHPVKAKLSSGIFQVEGNFAYQRTSPDRCYESADAAASDGLRAAKR
jgi:hypothetical protein